MPRVARINLLLQHGDPPYFGEGHMSNAQTPPTDFTVFVDGVPYVGTPQRGRCRSGRDLCASSKSCEDVFFARSYLIKGN